MATWIKRILIGSGAFVGLAILALVALIAGDGLLGQGRLDALTNTRIANTAGPELRAYVARPQTPGPHPAVIMIHEFWGLKPEIAGKADALAEQGYIVVAPDLFRGSTTSLVPRAIFQVVSNPPAQVNADLDAVFAWLASQPDVRADRIAVMGFCFGGGTSLRYSLTNNQIAATAIFYGSVIGDAGQLAALPGPVLGIFGGADVSIPLSEVRAFEAGLQQAGVPHEITVYEGQPHAFVTSMEEIRRGGAQQQAWNQLLAFLDRSLRSEQSHTRALASRGEGAHDFSAVDLRYLLMLAVLHAGHSH